MIMNGVKVQDEKNSFLKALQVTQRMLTIHLKMRIQFNVARKAQNTNKFIFKPKVALIRLKFRTVIIVINNLYSND